MKILTKILALAVAVGAATAATPASAQATRTWVSGVGDDVNPCSRTAPCKTFAGAISKTAPGGEINCLDPAGFGAVTITKSITIDCTGTLGGILASSTTGVIVNGAGAIVFLRGLEINGGPPNLPGVNGVRFLQGASLNIEDCTIYNFLGASPNGFGVIVNNTSTQVELFVTNTTIQNNGPVSAVSGGGIAIIPTGTGSARFTLNNVRLNNNAQHGLLINTSGTTGTAIAGTINNSAFNGNANGVTLITASGGTSISVIMDGSDISNNTAIGIAASNNGVIRVSNSTITGNATGLSPTGIGQIQSFGGNRLISNPSVGAANNGAFTFTNTPL
jgi:hypothetical protein